MNQNKQESNFTPPALCYKDVIALLEKHRCVIDKYCRDNNLIGRFSTNSKSLKKDDIFIAYRGVSSDGHAYIKSAVDQQCSLIIIENKDYINQLKDKNWLLVKDGRAAWSWLCAEAYGHPQEQLDLIGITGTNGKSSTVWIIRSLLELNHIPCLSIGTLGSWLGGEHAKTEHTTPDPPELYQLMAKAVNQNISLCVMEASSHALTQQKLAPCKFSACGFTSFSRDHLDFHQDMESYFQAKWQLFKNLSKKDALMLFYDELEHINVNELNSKNIFFYGSKPSSGFKHLNTVILKEDINGTTLQIDERLGNISLIGQHGAYNFCCALAISEKMLNKTIPAKQWSKVKNVPGRLDVIREGSQKPIAIIDYAHTPDALKKALLSLKPLCRGKLWVVFGCGGDRDRGKRPQMARIASDYADYIVLTSDNPRSEEPQQILTDIKAGIDQLKKLVIVEVDRKKAIYDTIKKASAHDFILIAGKGHEDYQIIKDKTLPFNDKIEAHLALKQWC